MEENNTPQESQEEKYVPRPKWQVWTARAALVILIIGIILYYYWIAYPYH